MDSKCAETTSVIPVCSPGLQAPFSPLLPGEITGDDKSSWNVDTHKRMLFRPLLNVGF